MKSNIKRIKYDKISHNSTKLDNFFNQKRGKIISVVFYRQTLIKIISVILLILTLTLCLLPFNYQAIQVYSGVNQKMLPIYSVGRKDKVLAISFDCAWGVDYTDKLLDIMLEKNIKCTFFMVEFWVNKYPEYVEKIDRLGFEIGTHSSTHPYMTKLNDEQMGKEFISSKACIQKITGKKVHLFRAPFGDYNNKVLENANRYGLTTIQWDVDSLDWKDISAEEIFKRVTSKVDSGSIVLFHNQGLHTHEALPKIIDYLHNDGFRFVTIGELIYKDNFYINDNGVQIQIN